MGSHRFRINLVLNIVDYGQKPQPPSFSQELLDILNLSSIEKIKIIWGGSFLNKRCRTHFSGLYSIESSIIGQHHHSMTHEQSNDHEPYEEGRKSCHKPKNHDSWLYKLKKRRCPFMHNPEREIPELQDPQCHIQAEQIKRLLIFETNTGLCPYTMMIHFILA